MNDVGAAILGRTLGDTPSQTLGGRIQVFARVTQGGVHLHLHLQLDPISGHVTL